MRKYSTIVSRKPGRSSGHWLRPRQRLPETTSGSSGCAVAAHEQGLVQVVLGVAVDRRAAEGAVAERQIAGHVVIDQEAHLGGERLGVKPRRFRKGAGDQALRHAMVDDEIEADLLAGPP